MNKSDAYLALNILLAIFAHPFYLLVSYFILIGMGFYYEPSANVVAFNKSALIIVLAIIFALRYFIQRYLVKLFNPKFKGNVFREFTNNHIWLLPGLFLTIFYFWEIEGNIMGFLIFPLTLAGILVLGSIVLYKNIKMLKK